MNYPELAKIAGNFRQPADRTSENSNSSLLWSFKGHVEEPASPGAVASATCRPEGQVNAVAHAVSLAVRTPNCKLGNRWAVGLQFAWRRAAYSCLRDYSKERPANMLRFHCRCNETATGVGKTRCVFGRRRLNFLKRTYTRDEAERQLIANHR